ncbi:MAG TPA: hypothetical protein VNX28_13470 [Gemmataceae bacterium]|jgi:hypothetical protein|nr:hypothetical protein [Gemmataceae bacterium]
MSLPSLLENVKKRPGMYFPKVEFDVVAAFITGFNLAGNGGLLLGFRQWLIVKLGYGNNLAWDALVLRLTFPEIESSSTQLLAQSENQKRAVESLFGLIETFLEERDATDGLRKIFLRYEGWLKRQDWYVPSSPQWIADDTGVAGKADAGHVLSSHAKHACP